MPNYQNNFPPIALNPGDSAYLFGTRGTVALAANGLVRNNGIVTATTGAAHSFVPGQQVDIGGTTSTAFGANSDRASLYGFDGSFTILTVPSTTTFTYSDLRKPNDTGSGGSATSIQGEQPAVPQASDRLTVFLEQQSPAHGLTFEIWFTGAPGAFELDIQEASADVDSGYVLPTNTAYKITAVSTNNYASTDLIPFGERFARGLLLSRANAVGVVLKANRVA